MPLALPVKQSLESKIFGYDKDDAPPATLYRAPPNPWMFRVADSPLGINPQRLILRRATAPLNPSDVTVVARSSNPCPAPTSRPTIPLPLRAKHNSVPLAWSAPSTQSSSDYAVLQGSGNKRKALNPPDPRPQKKSPLVSHSPLTAPTRPQKSALHCGIDGCAESFANKTNLQRHQQRHLHSRQRIHCSGCPAVFVRMEHLHAHLSHSAGCTSESAAQLLQSFYLQPEIRAINPTTASQTDLMAYWRRFLEVATVHIAQRKQVG
ncbi:hypothetical protein B0H19DRAFT_231059 [Mycena capillaripes]|nr:hypothetical protein B0H19DRAFT_231059 [Mycena capillaripes]